MLKSSRTRISIDSAGPKRKRSITHPTYISSPTQPQSRAQVTTALCRDLTSTESVYSLEAFCRCTKIQWKSISLEFRTHERGVIKEHVTTLEALQPLNEMPFMADIMSRLRLYDLCCQIAPILTCIYKKTPVCPSFVVRFRLLSCCAARAESETDEYAHAHV